MAIGAFGLAGVSCADCSSIIYLRCQAAIFHRYQNAGTTPATAIARDTSRPLHAATQRRRGRRARLRRFGLSLSLLFLYLGYHAQSFNRYQSACTILISITIFNIIFTFPFVVLF